MIGTPDLWRARLKTWAPAAAFFAVNLVVFAFYLVNYAGEGVGLERRLTRGRGDLAEVDQQVAEVEQSLARAIANADRVESFYLESLATEEERLTAVIAEVKRLAELSGLRPRRIAYPTESIEDFGLVKRSITFPVVGTYAQLRQMVNLLELSDYFLTLEGIQLRGGGEGGGTLRISLSISTLFAHAEQAEDLRG